MRKIITVLLCLCLIAASVFAVYAVDVSSFLQHQEIVENRLILYGRELPTKGKLTVSIGSQQVEDAAFSTLSKEKLPVTVYCLVDTSTGWSGSQERQQKEILSTISSRMSDGDSMVIALLGDDLVEGSCLTTMEARQTAIDSIHRQGRRTNLYQAVVDALQSLETKTTFATNRCLLILSDGLNDGLSSTTELQAMDAIRASTIPVYSIAIVNNYAGSYELGNAKHVIRMSDESVGGFGIVPHKEKISAATAAERVWESIQNSSVFLINLDGVETRANNAPVRVRYETEDTRYEDSMEVDLSGFEVKKPHEDKDPDKDDEQEAKDEESEEDDEKKFPIIPVAAAGAAVVLALIICAVVLTSKKKKAAAKAEAEAAERNANDLFTAGGETLGVTEAFAGPNTEPADQSGSGDAADEPVPGKPYDVQVEMVAIMHPDVNFTFGLMEHVGQVIGRSGAADIVLNSRDGSLSGRHCRMEWDGQRLYIQDIGSMNGTFLDGIRIENGTWHVLENRAKVRMGEYEYRVSIKKQN